MFGKGFWMVLVFWFDNFWQQKLDKLVGIHEKTA